MKNEREKERKLFSFINGRALWKRNKHSSTAGWIPFLRKLPLVEDKILLTEDFFQPSLCNMGDVTDAVKCIETDDMVIYVDTGCSLNIVFFPIF